MAPAKIILHQLAALGGHPTFPRGSPVPLIQAQGYHPKGEFSAIHAMLANKANEDSRFRASQQRFVFKVLPGVENSGASYRVTLQRHIEEFLRIDPTMRSIICVRSGTNAIRAVLKGVRVSDDFSVRNEVIVPGTIVGATIEAVIEEDFKPVFEDVDPVLSTCREDTEHAISSKAAANCD